MALVCAYRRPASVEEALKLLESRNAVVVAGGTKLNAAPLAGPIEVVDLQALGLDRIEAPPGDMVRMGAMTRLRQIADSSRVPGVIREAARREQPATLRAQATLGGGVAAKDAESELLAALLVYDAVVSIAGRDATGLTLAELLAGKPLARASIITGVTIRTSGRASAARAARTRADRPIVAAVARITATGERRLALAGVAAAPVLVEGPAAPGDPDLPSPSGDFRWLRALNPAGDFRGSGEYRRALAAILAGRALEAIS